MPDRGRVAVLAAIGAYNLAQNLSLPNALYVPANLVATSGLLTLARRYGCSWEDLGLKPGRLREGLRLGLLGVAGSAALALAANSNPTLRPYLLDERAARQRRRDITYRVLLRLPLGTALFEEVAFRGVVSGMWRKSGASPRQAKAAAAIAFGIWHLIPANQALAGNPLGPRFASFRSRVGVVVAGALLTSLSSLGLSWMRERSGSLLAPWMTHAAINSAVYLAGVTAWRASGAKP